MPLDLKKLRQDPVAFEASLRRSLALRRRHHQETTTAADGDNNSNNDEQSLSNDKGYNPIIDNVLRLHQESSTSLLTLHQCRAKRNEQKKQRQEQAKQQKKQQANSSDDSSEPFANATDRDDDCSNSFPTKEDEEELAAAHRKAAVALERALLDLPNYVDETILSEYTYDANTAAVATIEPLVTTAQQKPVDSKETMKKKAAINNIIFPQDAFYCLGGYEELAGLFVTENIQSTVLTDLGMQLLTALETILLETLCIKNQDQQSSATFAQWTLPETMPLSRQSVYSIWGHHVGNEDKNSGDVPMLQAPSWMGFLRHYLSGKTYYDRELPMCNFIFSSPTATSISQTAPVSKANGTDDDTTTAAMNGTLHDTREVHRRATWTASSPSKSTNGKKNSSRSHAQHVPWYDRLVAGAKRVELVILTGPSLQADSRIVQKETMQRLVDFYTSLLPTSADAVDSVLQIRAVPPSQLLPAESSRLVLQGDWPSATAFDKKKTTREPVCLAYLSNLQDYASCFIDATSSSSKTTMTAQQQQQQQNLLSLRHGNSRFGERVHVLQGTICSLAETLEWMIQHNADACAASGDAGGIDLPTHVTAIMHSCSTASSTTTSSSSPTIAGKTIEKDDSTSTATSTLERRRRLAYKRTVSTNKHGKRIVAPVPVPKPPRVDLSKLSRDDSKEVTNDDNDEDKNNDSGKKRSNGICILEIGQKVSPDEIRREALSCPFHFLPFHHKTT